MITETIQKFYHNKTYNYTLENGSKSKTLCLNIYMSTVQKELLRQYLRQGWVIQDATEVSNNL